MRFLLKWTGKLVAALALMMVVGGCVAYVRYLPNVSDRVSAAPARPPMLGPFAGDPSVVTAADWTERRAPRLREAFQRHVYGRMPAAAEVMVEAREALPAPTPSAVAEQLTLRLGPGADAPRLNVVVVSPEGPGPHPVILTQTFCGNRAAMGGMAEVDLMSPVPCGDGGGVVAWLIDRLALFGEHIAEPPWEEIVGRGYAVATFYAGDVVPDSPAAARRALARLYPGVPEAERGGAVAAWAWTYSRVLDALEREPRLDVGRQALWGHSRNGKAALLAAAFDPRPDAVISHQSGKGGATLTRADAGESVEQITGSYGYWFGDAYAAWGGREAEIPVDQHQLIALIAPRPVLLGHGRRDKWSDPQGAWRAAEGASPVWDFYGAPGLVQTGLAEPDFRGRLAFFMRPGRHGVSGRDWDYFLDFLDAAWGKPQA